MQTAHSELQEHLSRGPGARTGRGFANEAATEPGESDAGAAQLPDARRLHAQLAALVEQEDGGGVELRPLLEFMRAMLGARAVALVPVGEQTGLTTCAVTTRGILASSLTARVARLDARESAVQPAPELSADGYTLAAPVRREGAPLCWLLAQVVVPNPRDLQAYLVLLQALGGFVLYREQRRSTREIQWALERTVGLLGVFRRAGSELDFDKACRIAVDALRDYFGCARVSLGAKRRDGVQLRAISGIGHIDPKNPAHQPVEAAMREAMSAERRIDFTAAAPRAVDTVAHELLQQKCGASALSTIPLARGRGAVLLEWSADSPPTARFAALVDAGEPFVGTLFDLLERAKPNRAMFVARRIWGDLAKSRQRAVIVGVVAFAVLLAWPFHDSIRADCRLAPTVKRVVAAPFQGQLKRSFVRPGDHVTEGQALAEMDNRELVLKEGELSAARERALKQRDKAMSNEGEGADFAAAQLANFEAQSIGQDLELARRRIAMLEIKAPIAGVVVSGDLRRAEGLPVPQGHVLYEVAPLDEMILEIDVPDREISRVNTRRPVRFRLEAFAGESWSGRLEKVHPQSEQRDGHNVFIGEAAVRNADSRFDLRPGMRGRAVIEGDRRPLLWIVGHRLWEFVVTTLFW